MKEKYFPRNDGDEIVVTRKSDRKTIAFSKAECVDATGTDASWHIAVALAKTCDDSNWG